VRCHHLHAIVDLGRAMNGDWFTVADYGRERRAAEANDEALYEIDRQQQIARERARKRDRVETRDSRKGERDGKATD
jgi:hypothetical protein